ncbi:amidase [Microbacterium kribbense]|uniref:Amidase n=1 Tax=Microbacterium kribbense TaxID=433645 RepID=A0ABP7GIZ3_9MICO
MSTTTAAASWATASLSSQSAALNDGRISARELVDLYLERIDRLNPQLNAVVTVDAEGARRAADHADAARRSGQARGPLAGIPFTVKDAIATAGLRTTAGAEELRENVPAEDAPAIRRLRDGGAILVGKSNLPRWSGNIQTSNDVFGTTNNPWDPSKTPGGSSGGAAAAVASGLSSFDIGSDLGGSIRIPSHFCGIVGHRPSYGLVPQRGYIDHIGGGTTDTDLNVLGPMARSVADVRLILQSLAGPDPNDAPAWRVQLPEPRHRDPRAWRVAVWLDDGPDAIPDDHVRRLCEQAVDALAAAGPTVVRERPAVDMDMSRTVCADLIAAAILPSRDSASQDRSADSHLRWLRNRERVTELRAAWGAWFSRFDVLICPVMGVPAFAHDSSGSIGELSLRVGDRDIPHRTLAHTWNAPSGVVGLPSTVVPVGLTPNGLPVGVQVVGPFLEDLSALAVAELLESATGGYAAPPLAADC